MSDLKPGDRALVVWPTSCCGANKSAGSAVTIVEAKQIWTIHCSGCGAVHEGAAYAVDLPPKNSRPTIYQAHRLIRIPPDSEMRQMFRETSKPKETA